MNEEVREKLVEIFTDRNTFFLIGAGCSACAGKPLIGYLTADIIDSSEKELQQVYSELVSKPDTKPTIEDLLNYLIKLKEIFEQRKEAKTSDISPDEIETWLKSIKEQIRTKISDKWVSSEKHEKFFKRLNLSNLSNPRDIYSLNYDTIIEASLDAVRLPYVDGFYGTNLAWFDGRSFDDNQSNIAFRVFKMHGSINWFREIDGCVIRKSSEVPSKTDDSLMIYPSEQKYIQTQFGVYENLFNRFRSRLRCKSKNNYLVVMGYSFGDEHINQLIFDALYDELSNLTVYAFVGHDKNIDQDKIFTEIYEKSNQRFNVFIGSEKFIGNAISDSDSEKYLELDLWKFENLVDILTGEEK